jgi:hypothetical protein
MKKIKIIQRTYSYECGDGCCTELGTDWFINNGETELHHVHSSPCEDSGWLAVLSALGIDAEIDYLDAEGDEVASLAGPDERRTYTQK